MSRSSQTKEEINKTMIQRFAENLVNQGVKFAFGVTGSGASLKLITELQKLGVRYYPVFHEASAAIMAGAAGHDGKLKAVAITIKGPGFINLLPGLLCNRYENRPMYSISEAYAETVPQFRMHKRLDHPMLSEAVVLAYSTASHDSEQLDTLKALAESYRPGPVHLDLTQQWDQQRDNPPTAQIYSSPENRDKTEDSAHYQNCVKALEQSQKPVIILGSLAARQYACIDWNQMAVPIVTTAAAKGVIDETQDYAAGIITGEISDYSPETHIISQADCLLAIGLCNTEVIKADSYGKPTFIIDQQPGALQEGFAADGVVCPQDSTSLSELLAIVATKSWGRSLVADCRNKIAQMMAEHVQSDGWNHAQVFETIQAMTKEDYSLVVDTGFFCTVAETVFKAKDRLSYLGSGIGRFMGVALPSAIGFALAHPQRTIFCAVGDGGLPPYLSELKLAIKEKLRIIVLFFSDGRYGSVASYAEPIPAVKQGVNFEQMDWFEVVKAMGASSSRVENKSQLQQQLKQWQIETGPLFLQLDFDPDIYAKSAKLLR